MRIALLSDIHANNLALRAVLKSLQEKDVTQTWFLGDAFGRGPNPVEISQWLIDEFGMENSSSWGIGNHDAMVGELLSQIELVSVNEIPKRTAGKHRQILLEKLPNFLENLAREWEGPKYHELDGVYYVLVHASLVDHVARYIYPWLTNLLLPEEFARLEKLFQKEDLPVVSCFGHTHVPTLISGEKENNDEFGFNAVKIIPGETYYLGPEKLWLVNPGSVGQPRDLDTRAAYAILDTLDHTVTFKRVTYPWKKTAKQLFTAGYDDSYINKLRDATPDKETPDEWLAHYRKAKVIQDE